MPSTSVHLPVELLRRLDRVAKRRGISRNRLITEACRSVADAGRSEWPEGFFATEHLAARDLQLLRATFGDWLDDVSGARKTKRTAPFR